MSAVVIAGTHSGCGKTTATLGMLAALKKKGLEVQPFKAGPDFIDTGLHRIITGKPSRNLDLWMCGKDYIRDCFHKYSQDADISIIEGVMGLYDGDFNTAKLADVLNLPIILVVDAYGMAESAGAVVKGFMEYKNPSLIAGIIFNRVASEKHYRRLRNSIHDIEVLGYLPRNLDFEIPHRHLGLTIAEENPLTEKNIERLAETVLEHVDVDAILHQGARVKMLNDLNDLNDLNVQAVQKVQIAPCPLPLAPSVRIAVAYDRAFCFYYEDNLDLLRDAGAEIVTFSPISDTKIPENADALYIGGGYPELHARELSQNTFMLESIYNWADSGKPVYAECGGLMYLSQGIHDFEGNFFKMIGVFPFETVMRKGRPHLGYREVQLKDSCIIGKEGATIKGHEFHYSEIKDRIQNTEYRIQKKIYSVKDSNGQDVRDEGYRVKNTIGSYIHIHFGSNPDIAGNFIDLIKEH